MTINIRSKKFISIGGLILAVIVIGFIYLLNFTAPQKQAEAQTFIVLQNAKQQDVVKNLHDKGFIKSVWAFNFVWDLEGNSDLIIQPGGYQISKNSSPWKLAQELVYDRKMQWVVIPEGWRKEQIAELLAKTFNWQPKEKNIWVNTQTAMKFDYVEGVYFPDTYLIPVNESPSQIAERMRRRFDEQFAPAAKEAINQNIKWTTALKLASIVQREAGGKDDMPIIAGILWNRLLKDMKLEVDATVQYARDSKLAYAADPCEDPNSGLRQSGNCYNPELMQMSVPYTGIQNWWKPITPADKDLGSLYNTYLYKGLPPHPIDNPGLDSINAVLHPADTECLYYLHDSNRQIHCAKTYEEHLQNIDQYLKN